MGGSAPIYGNTFTIKEMYCISADDKIQINKLYQVAVDGSDKVLVVINDRKDFVASKRCNFMDKEEWIKRKRDSSISDLLS